MIIELQRVWYPGSAEPAEPCGVCGHDVATAVGIITRAASDSRDDMGQVCPECIAYLGTRNPEKAPTHEEYEEALQRYPRPMYESEEALEAASRAVDPTMDPADFAEDESWIWTVAEGPLEEQSRA